MTELGNRLSGKAILIIGVGGIGDELVRRYAAEGACVVAGDIDGAAAETVAHEVTAASGRAIGIALDGTVEDSLAKAVALAQAEFGGLDGLHANFTTVLPGDFGNILDLPMADFDACMNVTARGYVLCTRAALPAMLARGGGSIIYTSSDSAYMAEPVRLAYAMAKAAIHGLMRHVASCFGPQGIRANVIAPGVMWHPKLERFMTPEMVSGFQEANLLKTRLGAPGDIAALGALLLSDEGAYITGQVMNVNGGQVLRP